MPKKFRNKIAKMSKQLNKKVLDFPNSSGIYLMKDRAGSIIYIGKATSLKERLRSYFQKDLMLKTQIQMQSVNDVEIIKTDSALEALFLESKLIKKYSPKYNIKEKDDKSRIYVYFTKEEFPAIKTMRETDLVKIKEKKPILYGPFTSSKSVSDALEIIRKIFPFRTCNRLPKKKCLYGYIGLCEAPCENNISVGEYKNNLRQTRYYFEGKKLQVIKRLKKDLELYSKNQEYEKAAEKRDKINALDHLAKMFVLSRDDQPTIYRRIEGYDISNIFGEYAVGSMVVFTDGVSDKSEYRKFKIKWVKGANDIAMIREVLSRRFNNKRNGGWAKPDLVIVDGGKAQVNTAVSILSGKGFDIPVIGIAKGRNRKQDEIITSRILPRCDIVLFKKVRDEAHRFAKGYYEKLHRKKIRDSHKAH